MVVIDGVPIAQDAARRAIASAEDDIGVGPFSGSIWCSVTTS
jgi:hypothetical protein